MTASVITPDLLRFSQSLADISGEIIRRYFRTPIAVDDKADHSPVTIADREVEAALREQINRHFPQHGIYGEEYGTENTDAEFVWVLDPIDGTKSFITGKPLFGTLIALLHQQRPVLGVLDQPFLRERWLGATGHPTTLNGQAVRVRTCDKVQSAALYSTSPLIFRPETLPAFQRLQAQVKLPIFGGDCYAYALAATGFVDLVVEDTLQPYDYCALVPIIEQAGGIITDWQGKALDLHSDGTVIAAGDVRCHAQALQILNESAC